MSLVKIHQSNATINVGSNAAYAITGDDDTVLIGANSVVSAIGSALLFEIAGAGNVVTLGGNGQFASDANDDIALFQGSGILHELANSRVDANASNARVTMAGYDNLGVYGAGDVVTATGGHNGVWIGQNGAGATGAALDRIVGLTDSSVFELAGSAISLTGSMDSVAMNGDDVLIASGDDLTISGSGKGNVVSVSGGGSLHDNYVTLADGGTVVANANFLHVAGNGVTLRGKVFNSVELIGAGDTAVLDSFRTLTVGGNGENGSLDVVRVKYNFSVEQEQIVAGSNVEVIAVGDDIIANGQDRVTVVGGDNFITDTTGGNVFVINGNNNFALNLGDVATLHAGDTVHMAAKTYLSLNVAPALPTSAALASAAPPAVAVTMGSGDWLNIGAGVSVYAPVAIGASNLYGLGADDRLTLAAHFTGVADLLAHTLDFGYYSIIQFDSAGDQLRLDMTRAQVGADANAGTIRFA